MNGCVQKTRFIQEPFGFGGRKEEIPGGGGGTVQWVEK